MPCLGLTVGRSLARRSGGAADDAISPLRRWGIVAMLFTFMLVNFCDKAVVGLAAVPIMSELHLSHSQFGIISSGFFYLFSVSAVVVGFVVNRAPTRLALLAMALVWAASQFVAAGAAGIGLLLASRMALGAGEGPAYPVAVHGLYKWFPDEQRTLPTAILSQGSSVGIVVALPLLNWLVIAYSWHLAFAVLGAAALLWAALWLVIGREGPIHDSGNADEDRAGWRIPYRRLLLNRTMLGAWIAGFGAYWGVGLLVSWFTPFLVEGLHLSQEVAGFVSTLPWALSVVSAVAGGWISQRMLLAGMPSWVARGLLGGGMVASGGLAVILIPFFGSIVAKLALLTLGLSLPGLIYSLAPAIMSEITPPSQRGAVLAIGTAVATSAGLFAPMVMGWLIDVSAGASSGYMKGFVVNGVLALVAGLIGMIFMRPEVTRARLTVQRKNVREGI